MKTDQFNETKSSKKGLIGATESLFRKFKGLSMFSLYLFTVALCGLILTLSLTPGIMLVIGALKFSENFPVFLKSMTISGSIVGLIILYIISVIFITPFFNTIILRIPKRLKPFRGNNYSLESIPWFIHNSLLYLVRYTCLEFLTPSPLNVLFFKMMGMKIGKGVIINTSNISDACLITLEDHVILGGSCHVLAHYSQSGFLIVSPVLIKKGASIGLKATVFGNVTIGENALIGPSKVVLPKTIVPDNERI